jgi:hypothetical protein
MSNETQEHSMPVAEPQAEHKWLQRLVGDWAVEVEAIMGPDLPPEKSTGTERVRSLGGLWTVGEATGTMPGGGEATMIMTLGYDPAKERFVGTFVGSMMPNMWVYEGALDERGNTLILETEGPSMAGDGSLAPYRDVIEMKSDDHRVVTSHGQGPDGTWMTFMTATYRRVR